MVDGKRWTLTLHITCSSARRNASLPAPAKIRLSFGPICHDLETNCSVSALHLFVLGEQ